MYHAEAEDLPKLTKERNTLKCCCLIFFLLFQNCCGSCFASTSSGSPQDSCGFSLCCDLIGGGVVYFRSIS